MNLPESAHECQAVIRDGEEYAPCGRFDTRHYGADMWFCPDHAHIADAWPHRRSNELETN